MVTAICNVFIDSSEKVSLIKKTLPRVFSVSDNWLIYIRGQYKHEVIKYIKTLPSASQNCIFFENLDDSDWARSAEEMLQRSKYEYIYLFLEDHFLLKPMDHFKSVIKNMIDSKLDYFAYSFFDVGVSNKSIEHIYPDDSKHFYIFKLSATLVPFLQRYNRSFYPFSLTSVSSKKYLNKLINIETKGKVIHVSRYIQALMHNVIFRYPKNRKFWSKVNNITSKIGLRFGIYTTSSPFNLERSLFDIDKELLPLKIGVLKEELFANWDDDNGNTGSSLLKRGLYPMNLKSKSNIPEDIDKLLGKEYDLTEGNCVKKQYYPELQRLHGIPLKYIGVISGKLKVAGLKEKYELTNGESIMINANIFHEIKALTDTRYKVIIFPEGKL